MVPPIHPDEFPLQTFFSGDRIVDAPGLRRKVRIQGAGTLTWHPGMPRRVAVVFP